jgi:hypothetical protein
MSARSLEVRVKVRAQWQLSALNAHFAWFTNFLFSSQIFPSIVASLNRVFCCNAQESKIDKITHHV